MQLLSNPVYVITVLLLLVVFAEWLGSKKFFTYLGSSLIVIIAAAFLANINLLPSSQNPSVLYGGIFRYAAPLAIFFLLLDVKLKDLKAAGLPMISMFFIGSLCTLTGTFLGYYIVAPQHHGVEMTNAVAGMYTGTYIGGSANLNAVALQYGVNNNGTLFAAINAVDNIVGTVWIIATIVLPTVLQRFFPRKKAAVQTAKAAHENPDPTKLREDVSVMGISVLFAIGFGALFLSDLISTWIPAIPSILTLTTIALVLAQVPLVHRIKGAKVLGYFLVLLFLAVVGAFCDINVLAKSGSVAFTLLIWVILIVGIHGLLIFIIGGIFKQDWDIVAIASNANVGGTITAGALATSLGRPGLRLPGILVGSVGNAIGTYAGIMVAEILK